MVGANCYLYFYQKRRRRGNAGERKTNNCLISLNVMAFPGLEDLASKGASSILMVQERTFPASRRNRSNRERRT